MTQNLSDAGQARAAAEQPASAAVFDRWAKTYDRDFSEHPCGVFLRNSVRRAIEPMLAPESTVLEFGCGTGEDAAWFAGEGHSVLATDVAPEMLNVARDKTSKLGQIIDFQVFDLNRDGFTDLPNDRQFDLVFANFGVFNCVADPAQVFALCERLMAPGGLVCTVVMGRFCAWETLWHGLRGHWRTASRRWRGVAPVCDDDAEFNVYYYGPGTLRSMAGGTFARVALLPIGFALPPSYLFRYQDRWPKVFRALRKLEKLTQRIAGFAYAADHYLLILRREPA